MMQEQNVDPAVPNSDTANDEEFRAVINAHAALRDGLWWVAVAGENTDGVTASVNAQIAADDSSYASWNPFLAESLSLYAKIFHDAIRLDTKKVFEIAYFSPTLTATRVVEIRANNDFSNYWASETVAAPDPSSPVTLPLIYSEFSEHLEEAVMIPVPVNVHRAFYALSQRGYNLKNYSESAMLELGVADMDNRFRTDQAKKEAADDAQK